MNNELKKVPVLPNTQILTTIHRTDQELQMYMEYFKEKKNEEKNVKIEVEKII